LGQFRLGSPEGGAGDDDNQQPDYQQNCDADRPGIGF
jgi:hypothetical protein